MPPPQQPESPPAPAARPPEPRRASRSARAALWALRLGLPAAVLVVVWHELARLDPARIRDILRNCEAGLFIGGIAAAFIAISAMGGYDVFAFTSTPSLTAGRRWARAWSIFAWSNFLTLGPIGGPALRLYLYRRAGMPMAEILRGLVRLYIAYFAGLSAWLIAVFTPVSGPWALPARILIAAALAPGLALAAARVLHWIRPAMAGPWPNRRITMLGVLGVFDWGAALACFALTARAVHLPTSLDHLGKTMFFGQFVGMASMVPGGLGSADAVWLNMLTRPGVPRDAAAAQVVLFRLAFYIIPWMVSLGLIAGVFIMSRFGRAGPARAAGGP